MRKNKPGALTLALLAAVSAAPARAQTVSPDQCRTTLLQFRSKDNADLTALEIQIGAELRASGGNTSAVPPAQGARAMMLQPYAQATDQDIESSCAINPRQTISDVLQSNTVAARLALVSAPGQ